MAVVIEGLPADELLGTALILLQSAVAHRRVPELQAAVLRNVFGSMLACARLLVAAGCPVDAWPPAPAG